MADLKLLGSWDEQETIRHYTYVLKELRIHRKGLSL